MGALAALGSLSASRPGWAGVAGWSCGTRQFVGVGGDVGGKGGIEVRVCVGGGRSGAVSSQEFTMSGEENSRVLVPGGLENNSVVRVIIASRN